MYTLLLIEVKVTENPYTPVILPMHYYMKHRIEYESSIVYSESMDECLEKIVNGIGISLDHIECGKPIWIPTTTTEILDGTDGLLVQIFEGQLDINEIDHMTLVKDGRNSKNIVFLK